MSLTIVYACSFVLIVALLYWRALRYVRSLPEYRMCFRCRDTFAADQESADVNCPKCRRELEEIMIRKAEREVQR